MTPRIGGFTAKVEVDVSIDHLESMEPERRYDLIGEAFFLCPIVFGPANDRTKFMHPMGYWLTQRCMAHVVRDKFTSGGRVKVGDLEVPQIIHRAGFDRRENILRASRIVTDEQIVQYWNIHTAPARDERISAWLQLVRQYFDGTDEECQVLVDRFSEVE